MRKLENKKRQASIAESHDVNQVHISKTLKNKTKRF